MSSKRDDLFASDSAPAEFQFDARVADVFDDMINRSVPGYQTIISMIGLLARRYCQRGSRVYDLGSSLGAACQAIAEQVPHHDYRLVAVDNSTAMVEKLRENLAVLTAGEGPEIEVLCQDLTEVEISQASVVVLNFTLQFIPRNQRAGLLQKIHTGLLPGGLLILSEKIQFPDPLLNDLFVEAYHGFKERMGYSRLEISRKRAALEKVLIPETLDCHRQRLREAGFRSVDTWFQCFNFASLVALK